MKNDEIIATPPGKTIKEQLKQQHMSQKELAKKMCISDKELALLLEGKALLTTEIANKLEKTLGISASFWNRLEEIYLEKLAIIEERKKKMKIEIGIEIEMLNGTNNEEVAKTLPKPMMGNDENDKAWAENNGTQGSDVSVRADGAFAIELIEEKEQSDETQKNVDK